MQKSYLLRLPREIRDMIISHYVNEADGYHFDAESGKLRTKDGRALDLNLMRTCREMAVEVRSAALERNILHFHPDGTEKQRLKAGHFHIIIKEIELAKLDALRATIYELSPFLTEEIESKVALTYPQLQGFLHRPETSPIGYWDKHLGPFLLEYNWGEPPTALRGYLDAMTRALAAQAGFLQALDEWQGPWADYSDGYERRREGLPKEARYNVYKDFYSSEYFLSDIHLWEIPSSQEISKIGKLFKFRRWADGLWRWAKWRFSAAAVAINFLRSFPEVARHARKIILHEDSQSVARPECHAQALIPFCRANPKLRIERRVSIWDNLLPGGSKLELLTVLRASIDWPGRDLIPLEPEEVSHFFAPWIVEASLLASAGMPHGSFSLVLDSGPFVEQSTQLFELLRLDAALQVARKRYCAERSITHAFNQRYPRLTTCEGFSKAIDDIIADKSVVSCSFPINRSNQTEYADTLFERCRDLHDLHDWRVEFRSDYATIGQVACQIPPSLAANWVELHLKQLINDERSTWVERFDGERIVGFNRDIRRFAHWITGGIFG